MFIDLILFYWIGRQPSDKADVYINEFMYEMNLSPERLVAERSAMEKDK